MAQQDMHKFLLKKAKVIAATAKQIHKDFDTDAVHKFRVEIKKLRALLRLLTFKSHKTHIKLPVSFVKLYSLSGALRDAFIINELAENRHYQLPQFENYLNKCNTSHQKKWLRNYSSEAFITLDSWLNELTIEPLSAELFFAMAIHQVKVIAQLYKHNPSENDTHKIRKRIKDMLYNCKILQENKAFDDTVLQDIPIAQLDELSDALGHYNDNLIFIMQLTEYMNKKISLEEKIQIGLIIKEEESKQQLAKKVLLKKVKAFTQLMQKALAHYA